MAGLVEIVSGKLELVDEYTGSVITSEPKWFVMFWDGEGVEQDRMPLDSVDDAAWMAERIAKDQHAIYFR